jgi:ADP-ribose pyrophosphatase YjhB (NUDIX family)
MGKVKVAGDEIDLRRGVDYIGVTVCFIIHDGEGNILLQKRSQNTRDEQGSWDIGGGAVEFGETLEEAVRREVLEELGAEPLSIDFLLAFEALRQNNSKKTHWVAISHAVKVDPAKVKIGEPHKIDELKWTTSNNLPTPMHSQVRKSMKVAKKKGLIK